MGVIIAVTIWPNGAAFVVIPERYPQPGAQSRRLTAPPARNPATAEDGGMGSQVAPSVPKKLLGLLDASAMTRARTACPSWPGRTGRGIPLRSGRGRGGAI